jgi:hypothetical protein
MYRTSTFKRSAAPRALTAFALMLGVATLAACRDDVPSGPTRPVSPSLDRSGDNGAPLRGGGSGIVIFSVVDGTNNTTLLTGAAFQITGPNNYSLTLADNSPQDEDPVGGQFKVSGLFQGTYTLCETVAPAKYMIPFAPKSPCRTFDIVTNGTTGLSSIKNLHIPFVTWSVTDPVNHPLSYAYFQLRDSTYTVIQPQIGDNGALDKNATLGTFTMELPTHGGFYVCETLAPSGYVPPTPNCKWVWAVGGTNPQAVGTFVNAPTYSMYFNVVDTFGKPLAGTKFVIKREYYPYSDIKVTDNIYPDRDPVTGKYFVVLPAQSWYTVCQTEAPYGYDAPKVNAGCYPIATWPKVGVPANAGTFVDTPWPVAR